MKLTFKCTGAGVRQSQPILEEKKNLQLHFTSYNDFKQEKNPTDLLKLISVGSIDSMDSTVDFDWFNMLHSRFQRQQTVGNVLKTVEKVLKRFLMYWEGFEMHWKHSKQMQSNQNKSSDGHKEIDSAINSLKCSDRMKWFERYWRP